MNIIDTIKEAQEAYYNSVPIMTDAEFDALWDKAKKEYPDADIFKTVGEDHADGFAKAKHFIPMGSQNKANTFEDMQKFFNSVMSTVIAEYKCDGISVELVYKDGKFVQAITRGDGEYGDDITINAAKMKGVPPSIKSNWTGSVRGEIMLLKKDKEKYFPEAKNCRNMASGISKRLDGSDSDKLTVVCYDARSANEQFKTELDVLSFLKENFIVVNASNNVKWDAETAMKYMEDTFNNLDAIPFDIDGIVFKQMIIDYDDQNTNVRPNTNIALKPYNQEKTTKLIDIEWSMNNGTMTPIAIFEPVNIDGATISRANLSNISQMIEMGIEIGKTIIVTRRNMVIPHVERVV